MAPVLLLLALSLPQAEVSDFARRVAQAAAQGREPGQRVRVLLRVEDLGGVGATQQLVRALEEALRQRGLEPTAEGESASQVHAYLSLRRGRPLAAARILGEKGEAAVLFAEFSPGAAAEAVPTEGPPLVIRTRPLLAPDLPVLDLEADAAGNLFVLHPDRVRVFDLNSAGLPMKAEVGLDTGAERLRDPLVRLLARDNPRQLELYSAAASVAAAPPLPLEGYALKTFGASVPLRLPHAWRAVFAQVQPVAGRNYFRSSTMAQIYGLAPVISPLRAHWVLLDGAGRLLLADADLRPLAGTAVTGPFGGDVASAALPCAGTVVLVAGAEPLPARDRVSLLRQENDRLFPYTSLELDGAVQRLKTLPATGEQRRILAIIETTEAGGDRPAGLFRSRIEEIELRCSP